MKSNAIVTSLAEVQDKYKDCNILLPVVSEVQLNPFYKYTVMEVRADTTPSSGDVFKVGSVKTGEVNDKAVYADVYSPAKPLLMKLAAAAGIQFDPEHTRGEYVSKNCYRAKAYGAMRMPDGTGKTHCDEKVINLEDEEDRLRLEFMDKSIKGIADWRAAKAAAELFKGEWVKTDDVDKRGYPVKLYKIADEDRQKYIDRSVLVNMTLLRKTFAEKAMTGAILRVIRALIGLKGTYTLEELKRPFAIPRVTFSPNYNDPEVRREMLMQGMGAVSNMFGTAPAISAPAPAPIEAQAVDVSFRAEDYADNPAFASDSGGEAPDGPSEEPPDHQPDHSAPEPDTPPMPPAPPQEDAPPLECSECGKTVTEKVFHFSVKKFGRPLCFVCQNKEGAR